MPAPKIPNRDELVSMMRNGASNAQCIAFLADRYDLRADELPGSSAISNLRAQYDLPRDPTAKSGDLIPWLLLPEHRSLWPAKMLRAEMRKRQGKELPGRLAGDLDRWLRRFEPGGDLAGRVVHYAPDTAEGFAYVLRGDRDTDLIHVP